MLTFRDFALVAAVVALVFYVLNRRKAPCGCGQKAPAVGGVAPTVVPARQGCHGRA